MVGQGQPSLQQYKASFKNDLEPKTQEDFTKKRREKNWKIALGCTQLQLAADALNDVVENLTGKKVGHYFFGRYITR